MPEPVRDFFEPRFGCDFSRVRLHTDAGAAESARALNAHAYTLGRDIVFGEGRYSPDTSQGRRLLAHELCHVLQQNGAGKIPVIRRKEGEAEDPELDLLLILGPEARDEYPRDYLQDLYAYLATVRGKGPEVEKKVKAVLGKYFPGYVETLWAQSRGPITSFAPRYAKLNLVFYDTESEPTDFFRIQANMIARSINAVTVTASCPKDKSRLRLSVGGTGFVNRDILPQLKVAVDCIGRNIDEVHVVGHVHSGVRFSRQAALAMAQYLSPQVRFVFHGCSVLAWNKPDLKTLLEVFGSEAEIFAHSTSGEAGRPYHFYKVTLPDGESELQSELQKRVAVIMPRTYIRNWAAMQTSERLYALLKSVETAEQEDAREVFIEVLSDRLVKAIRKWSLEKLRKRKTQKIHDWEKTIIEGEIALREANR